jgi:hypothetical protein
MAGAEGGVHYPLGRGDTEACLSQGGDDAGRQGIEIATRCFIDRVRDDCSTAALSPSGIPLSSLWP